MATNFGALAALMGGGMPSFPCAICKVKRDRIVKVDAKHDVPSDDLAEPMPATTVVAGTPVCDVHASKLVHGLEAAVWLAYANVYISADDVPA